MGEGVGVIVKQSPNFQIFFMYFVDLLFLIFFLIRSFKSLFAFSAKNDLEIQIYKTRIPLLYLRGLVILSLSLSLSLLLEINFTKSNINVDGIVVKTLATNYNHGVFKSL